MYFILLFETGNELHSLPESGKSGGHQEQNFRWETRCYELTLWKKHVNAFYGHYSSLSLT